jgi:hypothetical protein
MPMRRLLTFAAFLLILTVVSVCAQRSARGGGSHGGFSGSHTGFSHLVSPGRGYGGPSFGRPRVASHLNSRHVVGNGFRDDRFHGRRSGGGFRRRCFNCGYGYGYPYYAYYDPYWSSWWWDSPSSYDEDAARERQIANEMNAENLNEQRMLRERDQEAYAPRSDSRPAQARKEGSVRNDPATVLVFRDEHQRDIQNYAIVGGMLWNFTPQRTEKIPLAALDIPATMKANDDRGVDFRLPQPGAGQ